MKVYELMSALGELNAGEDVTVTVCLTLQELMDSEQLDKNTFVLTLDIDEVDVETGSISTTI